MSDPLDDLGFEPIFQLDGREVSRSPWGPDDQIGRLNWQTPASVGAVLQRIASSGKIFDLSVDYFIGMPAWTMSGDPPYQHWITHTPQGSVNDGLTGIPAEVHERFSLSADSFLMNTHCGTHIDTLNHVGYCGRFWNGWTPDEHLGGRYWLRGGAEAYPPIVARGVLLDVARLHGTERLPDGYAITAGDLERAASEQRTELQRGDVVLVRTGKVRQWPNQDYLVDPPGLGLGAAKYLCEEVGAMCVGTDTVAFEVIPPEESEVFLPVHAYMLATAGAQIMEIVSMEEIAAQGVLEFAFLAFPLRLRGSTGSPCRPIAIPFRA